MRDLGDVEPELRAALEVARGFGFLGPGDISMGLDHAVACTRVLERYLGGSADGRSVVDLGCGGGLPGLVAAALLPQSSWHFVDSNQRRMNVLAENVELLGLGRRCTIVCARAEDFGRDPRMRHAFDAVVARGFAAPAVTAECAAPLLRPDGLLVVSDSPHGGDRWPEDGVSLLGLSGVARIAMPFHFYVARLSGVVAPQFPRRVGIPAKRPLF